MTDLVAQYNPNLYARYIKQARSGVRKFDFLGSRRSGKSYFITQLLLGRVLRGDVVNVATMTSEQGRLGIYQDAQDIIAGSPTFAKWVEVFRAPREIRNLYNGGRMFFNSYPDPERAKGVSCDWLYINEANNFTERQYIDLSASVRKGVFCDRNPNSGCWTETNGFTLIHSTWQDNRDHLTEQQIAWFDKLKEKAESVNATPADIYFYRVYYLGEYAELLGSIFTPANMVRCEIPNDLRHWRIYCDPSALVGSDYFAAVLCATDGQLVYVVDAFSRNDCPRDEVVEVFKDWCSRYDVEAVQVETNGYIGQEFFKYIIRTLPKVVYYNNSRAKHERIMSNYENITSRMRFADTDTLTDYLRQVYEFSDKCAHDDNIDAINSAFEIYRLLRYIK